MKKTFITVLLFGWARISYAGSAGADPFNFLFLDANARAVGMGGAYTAIANDANALLYNPAGLGRIEQHEATFMHNQYFQGIMQEYIGYAAQQGWGLNLNYLNSGNVQKTTISNPDGAGLGVTGLTDLAFGAGYGRALNESLTLGVGLKYIRETIANISASGYAADLGMLYAIPVHGMVLGVSMQNLGPPVKFQSTRENMPLNLRVGLGYGFSILGQNNTLALDVTKERSEGALVEAGAETVVARMMPIRLGFNTRNNAGPGVTAGLGWILKTFEFDYAFVPFGDLGITHRLSATLRWGNGQAKSSPPLLKRAGSAYQWSDWNRK